MGRADSEGQGVVIFMLRLGCGVQETMGTEESLGLGQAQCRRQVQTRSQQDALMGQRIQTGPESEQRRGISPHSHPTRPGSSLLQGYIWLRLASWPQPLLPYGLLSRARPFLLLTWAVQPLPSPHFSFFSLHSCLFPLFPTDI